ncbi:MAG TPA: hypothetical protein VKY90_05510 [Candidatus Dormibacteraeota bacterium]|nr:hypothetical protein [Candidatus Dormibacteraeota bacterium]
MRDDDVAARAEGQAIEDRLHGTASLVAVAVLHLLIRHAERELNIVPQQHPTPGQGSPWAGTGAVPQVTVQALDAVLGVGGSTAALLPPSSRSRCAAPKVSRPTLRAGSGN